MALVEAKGKLVTVVGFGPTGEIVPISFDADGKLITSGGGVSTFIALTDVDEADYIGHAGQLVRVNSTPDGLEFVSGAFTTKIARAYLNSLQDIVTATSTKVLFDTSSFDPDSDFDLVNSKYVCSEAGYYMLASEVIFEPADVTADKRVGIYIKKNGNTFSINSVQTAVAGKYFSCAHFDIALLAVNDYIETFIYHEFGANAELYIGGAYNFLSVFRVA